MKKLVIALLVLAFAASPAVAKKKIYFNGDNNQYNQYNYNYKYKNNYNGNFYNNPYFWGGVAGGLIGGAIINRNYNRQYYPEYEVPPLSCWYKHIQVWDEEFQQYILVKKRVCSQY